jgi:hypothetical protein
VNTSNDNALTGSLSRELQNFIDRVVVPALADRFLREQAASATPPAPIEPAA